MMTRDMPAMPRPTMPRPLPAARPPARARTASRRAVGGAGLIEVLIAVLVLAIGLLGVAALQALSLRNSQSSLERTQAVIQTYSILDAMRANTTAARGGNYNIGKTCVVPTAASTLAEKDLKQWMQQLQGGQSGLGSGACGQIQSLGSNDYRVTVFWDDSRGAGGSATQNIVTETRL